MPTVVLTSFRDAPKIPDVGEKYSIARWQPKGCNYPRFPVAIQPYFERHLSPPDYQVKYEALLKRNYDDLYAFFSTLCPQETMTLLCWCNLDRQKGYDKLYCHRILVGYWIEKNFPSYTVVYRDGAENPVWENPSGWAVLESLLEEGNK